MPPPRLHEAPLDIMREHPEVLLEILALANVDEVRTLSAGAQVFVDDSALKEPVPVLRAVDFIATIGAEPKKPQLVVIVEVQRQPDRGKRLEWARYVTVAAARHQAEVVLIAWVFDRATAQWARGPHRLGPGFAYSPIVIGPDDLPNIDSAADAARHFDLALLTALTRIGQAESAGKDMPSSAARQEILRVAEAAARLTDDTMRKRATSLLHGSAKGAFRAILTKFLEAQAMRSLELIREEGREEGLEQGEARGRAATLLRLLRLRGFAVTDDANARVLATSDTALLDRWLDRVISAQSLDDVFAE